MSRRSSRSARSSPGGVVGVIDIGTGKVCCLIARSSDIARQAADRPPARVLGFGHAPSRGLKAGTIIDLVEAEGAVRAAVAEAERTAGLTLDSVHLAINCGRLSSEIFTARIKIDTGRIADADVARLIRGARSYSACDDRMPVLVAPHAFQLDGRTTVSNPRGMSCRELSARMIAVTADEPAVRNMLILLDRCHLASAGLVPAGYASALGVLTPEERRIGALTIDIGGGCMSVTTVRDDRLMHIDVLPVGGDLVTYDIARALSLTVVEAQRIKTIYGTLLHAASDSHEHIPLAPSDARGVVDHRTVEAVASRDQVSRAQLRHIIEHRVDALSALLSERLSRSGMADLVGRKIVVTGGTAMLIGMVELLAHRLGASVRLGLPSAIDGLPALADNAALATVAGMLAAAERADDGAGGAATYRDAGQGLLGRLQAWARESF